MKQPALFTAFPELREHIPWIPILPKPTPTRQLLKLEKALQTKEPIWIKLDNLTSDKYGGNKVRKLEFLLADALRQEKHQVATLGGLGTNHGLATTIHGQANNLRVRLYLTDQPITPHVLQNLKLLYHFGANMVYAKSRQRAHLRFRYLDRLFQRHTYWLPLGGSSEIGVLGYVNAVFELHKQINANQLPEPRRIFIPVGSFGTIAGIDLGLQLTGLSTKVKGICAAPNPPSATQVNRLIHNTLKLLQTSDIFQDFTYRPRYELTTAYAGIGYGAPSPAGNEATALAKEQENLVLEPTYTAKTLAGAIDYIRRGKKGPILYWHTFNSVNLSSIADKVDYRSLPPAFHTFFKSFQQ
ncbi:MAG: 1-aminocyclopropane-1-carboxylate deaminase/D-cysteine desulfhydrase [Promethearchaeota archaeon]